MAKIKFNQTPKIDPSFQPHHREARIKEQPYSTDKETPAWQFNRCDREHDLWGWQKLPDEKQIEIIKLLCSYERMTWADLRKQVGGRGHGTNHHPLPVSSFTKKARDRLQELKLDDYPDLFSLRLQNTVRLYGIKDGRVLKFIWYDPYHGSKNGAYPTKNSNQ